MCFKSLFNTYTNAHKCLEVLRLLYFRDYLGVKIEQKQCTHNLRCNNFRGNSLQRSRVRERSKSNI